MTEQPQEQAEDEAPLAEPEPEPQPGWDDPDPPFTPGTPEDEAPPPVIADDGEGHSLEVDGMGQADQGQAP